MKTITEIVLKVTSICNLNCTYCYVYNKGDNSHKYEPNHINEKVITQLFNRIEEYALNNNIENITIILHGGEPLLLNKRSYEKMLELSKSIVKSTKLSFVMQSNATLMTESWANFLIDNNIHVGFSMDFSNKDDGCRMFKNGKSAQKEILNGIKIFNNIKGSSSVLSVIDIITNPKTIYKNLIEFKTINSIGFLLPLENHDTTSPSTGTTGKWLIELFDLWYSDPSKSKPKRMEPFDPIIEKIIGIESAGNEGFGENANTVLNVKTNGDIALVDSLKICGNGYTKTNYNIFDNKIEDFFNDSKFNIYYYAHEKSFLPEECQKCSINNICGGGYIGHRYSKKNGFDNVSIYCKDLKMIITHIQNVIYDSLPESVIKKTGLQRINLGDLL